MPRFYKAPPRVDASTFVADALRGAFESTQFHNYTDVISDFENGVGQPPAWQTWSIGLGCVFACSFAAPLGIIILPWLLPKTAYKHLMTFLIALGVGALSGSCFFIMIPQAFAIATLEDIEYETKSWIMVTTLYTFFVIDRLLQYGIEFRRRRRAAKRRIQPAFSLGPIGGSTSARQSKESSASVTASASASSVAPAKTANDDDSAKARSWQIMLRSTYQVAANCCRIFVGERNEERGQPALVSAKPSGGRSESNGIMHDIISSQHLVTDGNSASGNYQAQTSVSDLAACQVKHAYGACDNMGTAMDTIGVQLEGQKEVEVATVAYMIIFGSSANNFVDGMSTGAAFSDSILRGISIGIAVVSQQFPQELGTLAILTNSGLGLKRALLLNMVPIALSFAGFAVGVCLDELDDATDTYVFAVSSGMYLYIFLGTLMPELRDGVGALMKENMRESFVVSVLQLAGAIFGVFFMHSMAKLGSEVTLE